MKELLTGDEAVARGAWEAGCCFAAAYPGTPSTEILENLSLYPEITAEWSTNEKVALEAAIGASLVGFRSLAAMKHVGLNVAADPLFTFAYTGVNGGAVIITADEPGLFSSQNEQDNRHYAQAAKLPMLEPADSQECLDMTRAAFALSEAFDIPVLLRLTTRVCHSKSLVELGERTEQPPRPYARNIAKYVTVPAVSKGLRVGLEERLVRLAAFSETCSWNRAEDQGSKIGVICSGDCYYYAKEVWGESASYLKLGFTHPLPDGLIKDFCAPLDKIYVVEENDPYLEDHVRGLGFAPLGKEIFPFSGEMTPDVLRLSLYGEALPHPEGNSSLLTPRPPALCAGCPHRGFFYDLSRRSNVVVCGDIGCYTLGSAAPFAALDSTICMGASLSMGHGAAKMLARQNSDMRVVALLGDSTFFHTGINSLLNTAYNGGAVVNVILDNRITGMTGHQDNPGTGYTAAGFPAPIIDIEGIARAFGFRHIAVINPNDLRQVKETLDTFLALDEPSVIITRWPCALKKFSAGDKEEFPAAFSGRYQVDEAFCVGCKLCLKCGCPALSFDNEAQKARIDPAACLGCAVCGQLCGKNAIRKEEK